MAEYTPVRLTVATGSTPKVSVERVGAIVPKNVLTLDDLEEITQSEVDTIWEETGADEGGGE